MKVCVEGNIGCGKSTALDILSRRTGRTRRTPDSPDAPPLRIFPEPVEEWTPLLEKYYKDPPAWALPLSLRVLLSFREPGALPSADRVLVERSPLSCRHVFGQLQLNEGRMTKEEWEVFKEYCDVLGWVPDVIAYVHTPAETCHRRMLERDRPAERGVDLHYLKRLEFQYETMLRYADVPVVRIDGLQPPERVADDIVRLFDTAA